MRWLLLVTMLLLLLECRQRLQVLLHAIHQEILPLALPRLLLLRRLVRLNLLHGSLNGLLLLKLLLRHLLRRRSKDAVVAGRAARSSGSIVAKEWHSRTAAA